MQKLKILGLAATGGLLLLLPFTVGKAKAQSPADSEKPVWMLEFIKVKPGMLTPAMSYLDDDWMRVREKAKHEGAVVCYYRIVDENSSDNDSDIVLMTEFKNRNTFAEREKLFSRILKELPRDTSGVVKAYDTKEELFQSVSTKTYSDFSTSGFPQFRLLSER